MWRERQVSGSGFALRVCGENVQKKSAHVWRGGGSQGVCLSFETFRNWIEEPGNSVCDGLCVAFRGSEDLNKIHEGASDGGMARKTREIIKDTEGGTDGDA